MSDRSKKPRTVFISYSRSDDGLARRLAERLRSEHFEVFLDVEQVEPGANVAKVMGKALESADAAVVLLSRDSMESPWAAREWEYLLGSKRYEGRVVPVLVPGTPEDSVPWIWKHLDHVRPAASWPATANRVVRVLRNMFTAA